MSSLKLSYAAIAIVLTCFLVVVKSVPNPTLNVTFPALIVFGDSVMDAGTNNNRNTIAKCNYRPYGKDFENEVPTGRFSNGLVPSDIIAEELGIKKLLPSYLDPNLKPEDLLTGVTFASGGSGFDNATAERLAALTFSEQLNYFKEYIEKVKGIIGEQNTSFILENSLFVVVGGTNDLTLSYFTGSRQHQYNISAYTDLVTDWFSDFLTKIYQLGARRIAVFNIPPAGYLPAMRTLHGGIKREVVEKMNDAATIFNSKLSTKLDFLTKNLTNAKFVIMDTYTPLLDLIQNYQSHGYEVADKGCCGTGVFELAEFCNPLTPICPDRSKYVFFDIYHPTETGYRFVLSNLTEYINKFN